MRTVALLGLACLLVHVTVHAQSVPGQSLEIPPGMSCEQAAGARQAASGPEITASEVTFSGVLHLPASEREQIVRPISQTVRDTSLDEVIDGALEIAREGWQDQGYFKVEVTGDSRTLAITPVSESVAVSIHVEEGTQYHLGSIAFKNNRAISNLKILRGLFPINDGDIFSRRKIGTGLENLRKAYGQFGYLNFTSVPNTNFDEENKLISLEVDFDEGKQFFISGIDILGLDEADRKRVLKAFPFKRGQIYNSRIWEFFLLKYASMFPDCECRNSQSMRLDEKSGIVQLVLDFRPCPSS